MSLAARRYRHAASKLCAALALAAAFAPLEVRADPTPRAALFVSGPDETTPGCAIQAAFTTALVRTTPGVAVLRRGVPAGDDMVVELAHDDDAVAIVIVDADGRRLLSRRLARRRTDDCDALGQTLAFVVDRYLTTLAWPGLTPVLAMPGPAFPLRAVARAPARLALVSAPPVDAVRESAPRAATSSLWSRLELTAAAGAVAASDRLGAPGFTAALALRHPSGLGVSLIGALYPARRSDVLFALPGGPASPIGELSARRVEIHVAGERCVGGRVTGCLGLSAGAQLTSVGASGVDLYRTDGASAVHLATALRGEVGVRLPRRVITLISLSGTRTWGSTAFLVDGVPGASYATPTLGAQLAVTVGREFF